MYKNLNVLLGKGSNKFQALHGEHGGSHLVTGHTPHFFTMFASVPQSSRTLLTPPLCWQYLQRLSQAASRLRVWLSPGVTRIRLRL